MNKALLSYSGFVIASVIVILAFITATNYIQLAVAIVLYPLLVWFAYKILPRKGSVKETKVVEQVVVEEQQAESNLKNNIGISDMDKRVFLKLIGSAGLVLFFFSIFNKKAEGLFFKNGSSNGQLSEAVFIKDPDGNKISPAQDQPLDGYNIAEVDDKDIAYYGYTNKNGAWFVMKVDSLIGSFRYAKGDRNFPNSWEKREGLKYQYYNDVFNS